MGTPIVPAGQLCPWLAGRLRHDRTVPTDLPELSSLSTALTELTRRVASIAEREAAAQHDDAAAELFAVERSLTAAGRRLERLMAGDRRRRHR
jgi:type II secretory pathway component PulM